MRAQSRWEHRSWFCGSAGVSVLLRRRGKILVVEAISANRLTRVEAVVPIQLIFDRRRIVGKALARGIRIGAHLVEGQLRHSEGGRIPPVHVLHKSVGIEEVVAL